MGYSGKSAGEFYRSDNCVVLEGDCLLKMSCNGCRVLRKGCSESCILRPCLQWIDSADAQGHATVFVAKFFGRAGLMGFINAVPETQRRALFQSLLYEACGRTVNPVFGAVGLLWAGNWQVCQAAVETVLKGGSLKAPSPCSLNFASLTQGPLHPSNPGKDIILRGRESLLPSITTVVKEDTSNTAHDLCKARVGIEAINPFQRANGYESKDHAVVVKSSWGQKWDAMQQQEWPVKPVQHVQPQQQQQLLVRDTVKGNTNNNVVNSNVISWPEAFGNKVLVHKVGEKRERDFPQVLTPAARRVKPCGEYGMYGPAGLARKDAKFLFEDQETVVGSTEHLDLGLTLMVKDGKGGQITGLKRGDSPSCDSVNSEGSVTSLDTTPRQGHSHSLSHSHSHHASYSSFAGDMVGHQKLLPLLL